MNNALKIEIDTTSLNEHQQRLLKRINSLLEHVMKTSNEDEYFELSSEVMRLMATAIQKSNFNNQASSIEHSQQVLEFCVDNLSDHIYGRSVETFDN